MTAENIGGGARTEEIDRIDILRFLGVDEQNVLVSVCNLRQEINVIETVNELFYKAVPANAVPRTSALVLQLMLFAHTNLLSATSMIFRCRIEEAFSCTRVAIEAALHAYRIIEVGASPEEYVRNERHGEGNVRYLRALHKKDPSAHATIEHLLLSWGFCSAFGSHADYRVIKDRSVLVERPEGIAVLMRFNNTQPISVQQFLLLTTALTFIDILGVFSPHLRNTVKCVDDGWERWRTGLFNDVHAAREKVREGALREGLPSDDRIDDLLAGKPTI
jgi:hypothetical protein